MGTHATPCLFYAQQANGLGEKMAFVVQQCRKSQRERSVAVYGSGLVGKRGVEKIVNVGIGVKSRNKYMFSGWSGQAGGAH